MKYIIIIAFMLFSTPTVFAQVQCGACHGAGKTSCTYYKCRGKGHYTQWENGELVPYTCTSCSMTGKQPCNFCGGSGTIRRVGGAAGRVEAGGRGNTTRTFTDVLAGGKWSDTQGNYYHFTKVQSEYELYYVEEYGLLELTGKGYAIRDQDKVYLRIQNFFGLIDLEFTLNGNQMSGSLFYTKLIFNRL